MNRKAFWKYLSILIVTILMLSLAPEVRLFGLLIDAIGIDVFLLLLESQLIVLVVSFYHQSVLPTVRYLNSLLEKLDPYYFALNYQQVKQYPAMAFHSVPFVAGLYFFVIVGLPISG